MLHGDIGLSKSSFLSLLFTEDAQLTPLLRLGAGACAGIIAMSATYPMDMVRGRITVQVLVYGPVIPFVLRENMFSEHIEVFYQNLFYFMLL